MRVCSSKCLAAFLLLASAGPASAADWSRLGAYVLQQSINGLTVASSYCLLAVAYALLHGITGRIILSFGEVATVGAFAASLSMVAMMANDVPILASLAIVLVLGGGAAISLGHYVQQTVFTPLVSASGQAIMIASIGVSIAIQEVMRIESKARDLWLPPMLQEPVLATSGGSYPVTMTGMRLTIIGVAVVSLAGLWAVMRFSRAGRLWRACAQNRLLTELSGISTIRIMSWSAAAAAMFAAASGWIVAVGYGGVSFYMGIILGLKALFASIIGGFGTIEGAVLGGLVLAVLETAWSSFFPIIYRDAVVFLVIVAILVLKPGGLLGVPIRRDSEVWP
jgi:branched-chain amino acid transport system permease protein